MRALFPLARSSSRRLRRTTNLGRSKGSHGKMIASRSLSFDLLEYRTLLSGFTITDLGTISGYPQSEATGINASGQVAGYAYGGGGRFNAQAFLYSPGKGMLPLGMLPGYNNSEAAGVNSSGQVVGCCYNIDGTGTVVDETAFLYSNGKMVGLPKLPGSDNSQTSQAFGINDSGLVVGYCSYLDTYGFEETSAFSYDSNSKALTNLDQVSQASGGFSVAYAVNASGQAAGDGWYVDISAMQSPALYDGGTVTVLADGGEAYGINASRQVVGEANIGLPGGNLDAFLYSGGEPIDLGTLKGGDESAATGINASGVVVGWSGPGGAGTLGNHAFIYANGKMNDLGMPSHGLEAAAYAINDNGLVVGDACFANGVRHAVRWQTPPPVVPTKLVFSPIPAGIVAGVPFQVVVTAEDAKGNVGKDFNGNVTIDLIGSGKNDTLLGGGLTVQAVGGVATFSNLTLTNGTPATPTTTGSGTGMSTAKYFRLQAAAQLKTTGGSAHALSAGFGVIGYTPAQIREAYGLDQIPLDSTGKPSQDGRRQTIAIVDAYNDPDIIPDVDAFDQQFGLTYPGPTLFQQYGAAGGPGGFLTVLDQKGGTDLPTAVDKTGKYEAEEAMDVEWAHAIAPGAKIVLIECNSSGALNLYSGIGTAAGLPGVSVVSLSIVTAEGLVTGAFEKLTDSYFTTPAGHPGVTFVAATGDHNAGNYPAFSPNVVAVGGTTLHLKTDSSYDSESGWGDGNDAGSGGGKSSYEGEPLYQGSVQTTGKRTIPDVSFLADEMTPAADYNSYKKGGADPWEQGFGTSLGTPVWAGIFAIVNQGRNDAGKPTLNTGFTNPNQQVPTEALEALYNLPATDFNKPDVQYRNGKAPNHTTSAGLTDPSNYNEMTGMGTPMANLVINGLINYGSRKLQTTSGGPSSSSVLGGPRTPAANDAALAAVQGEWTASSRSSPAEDASKDAGKGLAELLASLP